MYHQFNIQQFYVLPHTAVFMCFVWISEQTAIISLYNINWLVFITETQCVYCAVRTGYLNIVQVNVTAYCVPYIVCKTGVFTNWSESFSSCALSVPDCAARSAAVAAVTPVLQLRPYPLTHCSRAPNHYNHCCFIKYFDTLNCGRCCVTVSFVLPFLLVCVCRSGSQTAGTGTMMTKGWLFNDIVCQADMDTWTGVPSVSWHTTTVHQLCRGSRKTLQLRTQIVFANIHISDILSCHSHDVAWVVQGVVIQGNYLYVTTFGCHFLSARVSR